MKLFRKEVTSIYDEAIEKLLNEMREQPVETEEYAAAVRHLETLTNLKAQTGRKKVDANTMATVVGNLLGILTIVAYEQKHVMGSKATGFILKPKS